MDHIDHLLSTQAVDRIYDAPIRAALAMGKKTLNRYYTHRRFRGVPHCNECVFD
jgi:hypothetical protein